MITIHATKKLIAKLPKNNPKQPVSAKPLPPTHPDDAPLGSWHANLLTLQGQNCLLFVHDATRFPVFIKQIDSLGFASLNRHFEDALMNTLLKLGAQQHQLDAAAKALAPLQFDSHCNRSVQGTMIRMAGHIEHALTFDRTSIEDIGAYSISIDIAEMFTKIKGMKDYIKPSEQMFTLLNEMAATKTHSAPRRYAGRSNVVKLDDYR